MKKKRQFHISIGRRKPIVIDLNRNEWVYLTVHNHPVTEKGYKRPTTTVQIDGNRWAGKDFFTLAWPKQQLKAGDSVTVALVIDNKRPTKRKKDEKYIEPEKDCSFCHKKASQVRRLIENDYYFCRICDECIEACRTVIKGAHAS
jgi:hypothetical protein